MEISADALICAQIGSGKRKIAGWLALSIDYTSYGAPEDRTVAVKDPTLVGWWDATYNFNVVPRKGWLWSFLDDDPTNNGRYVEAPQMLCFNPLSRGEKLIKGYDPDSHVLRFDLLGNYFGKSFVEIDSSQDFSSFLKRVADVGSFKGGGDSYVTIYQNDIIVRIDGDNCRIGDLRMTFDGLASSVDLSGTVKVIDFDEFELADGTEASLLELNGGSSVYAGFEWSQVGIFNPAGDRQIGYDPLSEPNTAFIGEKDGIERPEYEGYDAPAGSPLEIYRDDAFTFVSAAFNAVNWDDEALQSYELTVLAFVDGVEEAVGRLVFTVDNQGEQDVVEFGNPFDDERFENINRLVIDGDGYFGIDNFTFV